MDTCLRGQKKSSDFYKDTGLERDLRINMKLAAAFQLNHSNVSRETKPVLLLVFFAGGRDEVM